MYQEDSTKEDKYIIDLQNDKTRFAFDGLAKIFTTFFPEIDIELEIILRMNKKT